MAEVTTPDGQRIAYTRSEGNHPVLLVHGFSSNAEATWGASGWFRALGEAGRGIVAVDLLGHGNSSKPTDPSRYRAELMARDLVEVLDSEGLPAVDVVGYSMGSQVARQLAGDHPDRVARLVLGGIGVSEPFAHAGAEAVRSVLIDGRSTGDPFLEELFSGAKDFNESQRIALAACAEGLATSPPMAIPQAPTLVVAGDLDPIAAGASTLANQLHASFFGIPGRRHGNSLSARAFKQVVMEFLSDDEVRRS
jgi:pimeloyl-ACP methyl ester carboxylesterase